jgi:hypothetical protein
MNLITLRRLSRLEKRMASDRRKWRFSDASLDCFVLGIELPNSGAPEYVRDGLREARGRGRIYPTGMIGVGRPILKRRCEQSRCATAGLYPRERRTLLLHPIESATPRSCEPPTSASPPSALRTPPPLECQLRPAPRSVRTRVTDTRVKNLVCDNANRQSKRPTTPI